MRIVNRNHVRYCLIQKNCQKYVTPEKEQGLILYFTKNENNTWEMSNWDCVWSKSGTADGIQWPYFWQNGF